jgi:hypothetical protein
VLADRPPTFSDGGLFNVDENQTEIGSVSASDPDGDEITYSLSGTDAATMAIDSASGALTFNSPADYETQWDFDAVVTATTAEASATKTIAVQINNLNDNPITLCGPSETACSGAWEWPYHPENTAHAISLHAADLDANRHLRYAGDTVQISLKLTDPIICPVMSRCEVVVGIKKPDPQYASIASVGNAAVPTETADFWAEPNGSDSSYVNINGPDWERFYFKADYGNWTYIQFFTVTLATDLANIPIEERRLKASVSSESELFEGFDPTDYILNELIPTSRGPVILAHSSEDLMHSISGGDASSFDIRSENGALTFIAPAPDYETQTSYSATISATDGIGIVTRDVNYIIEDDPSDNAVLNFDSDS